MAKSLGNFFTVKDLLDREIAGSVIRFVLLSSHYRDPLDWTQKAVDEARLTLRRWGDVARNEPPGEVPQELINVLADDINTPNAITIIHKLARERRGSEVRAATQFLGLGLIFEAAAHFVAAATMTSTASVRAGVAATISAKSGVAMDQRHSDFTIDEAKLIEELLSTRQAARTNKDFCRADAIRDGLNAAGVEIMDAPEGTAYRRRPDFDPAKLEALR
jgi:cysteinyl-tRNA synthetase